MTDVNENTDFPHPFIEGVETDAESLHRWPLERACSVDSHPGGIR